MALQASVGASGLDLENFPRLTFGGFKKRKPDRKSSRATLMGRSPSIVDWQGKLSHTSSPALKRARSAHDHNSLSNGGSTYTTESVHSANSHPSLNRIRHWSNDSQTGLLSFGSETSCVSFVTTQSKTRSSHSHSDFCLKGCEITKSLRSSDEKPSISVINSHSSLKCGTNIKTWYVKVQLIDVAPENNVDVSIDDQIVKIKIKYGRKVSGLEKIFGAKQSAVRKNLRFSGILDQSSLRTKIDKEGFLIIQLIEVMF